MSKFFISKKDVNFYTIYNIFLKNCYIYTHTETNTYIHIYIHIYIYICMYVYIGKYFYFLNLLDKHFPQKHHLHSLFNRKSIKVSYSCTKSMKTIINNHNKNIQGKKPSINASTCNCRSLSVKWSLSAYQLEACPLNGQCQIREVASEGTLSSNQPNCKEK